MSVNKTTDLLTRLRAPSNWLQQPRGEAWKDAVSHYDRAPFEAAYEIERLRAAVAFYASAWTEVGEASEQWFLPSPDLEADQGRIAKEALQ